MTDTEATVVVAIEYEDVHRVKGEYGFVARLASSEKEWSVSKDDEWFS